MNSIKVFIKSKPVLTYFIMTFAISWVGFIVAVGPGGFANANVWQNTSSNLRR